MLCTAKASNTVLTLTSLITLYPEAPNLSKLEFEIFLPRLFLFHLLESSCTQLLMRLRSHILAHSQDRRKRQRHLHERRIVYVWPRNQINKQVNNNNNKNPNQYLPTKEEYKKTYLSWPQLWVKERKNKVLSENYQLEAVPYKFESRIYTTHVVPKTLTIAFVFRRPGLIAVCSRSRCTSSLWEHILFQPAKDSCK